MFRIILFCIFISISFSCLCINTYDEQSSVIPVILDTDIGNDIDDVLALQMLLNYEKSGKIKILGITISKCNPYAIEYLDGYCLYNNRQEIPIGYAYGGVTPDHGNYLRQVLDTVVEGKKILAPQRSIRSNIPEGYKLLRKLLASQKDNSVIFIALGPETNLARLLNSGSDEYSDLNGEELVRRKVKLLSVMGGLYGKEFDFPEWNIVNDLKSAQTTFSRWPTLLIASGWELGNKIHYPHESILNDFLNGEKHPLCVSYKIFQKMPYDRDTWDLTSVLQAIESDKEYFNLSKKGTIYIDSLGYSRFKSDEKGKHQYLIVPKKEQIKGIVDTLVHRVTNCCYK